MTWIVSRKIAQCAWFFQLPILIDERHLSNTADKLIVPQLTNAQIVDIGAFERLEFGGHSLHKRGAGG